jgi:hypothetical protein
MLRFKSSLAMFICAHESESESDSSYSMRNQSTCHKNQAKGDSNFHRVSLHLHFSFCCPNLNHMVFLEIKCKSIKTNYN